MPTTRSHVLSQIPSETIDWLLDSENPAVAVLTRRELLGEADDSATAELWARRNEYAPVAAILEAQLEDGSWTPPSQDYRKYQGSLWQIHLLGELGRTGTIRACGAPPSTRSRGSLPTARGARRTCEPRARSRA